MSRIAYVSGAYVPHRQAAVHIEDRGYQFADGVYEVIAVRGGKLLDEEPHLRRLHRSLDELRIAAPIGDAALRIVLREVVRRNGVADRDRVPADHPRCRSSRARIPEIGETDARRDRRGRAGGPIPASGRTGSA